MSEGIIRAILAFLLTFDAIVGWTQTTRKEGRIGEVPTMSEEQSKAVELLKLRDDEYFLIDDQRALELQTKLAEMLRPPPLTKSRRGSGIDTPAVLAIGTSKLVDLRHHPDVLVLLATRQTGRREWEVKYNQNTFIVAADLRSGMVRTGQPLALGKLEMTPLPSMSGPPPNEINSHSTRTSVRRFGLATVLETELHPTKLAITVIVYDWVSNTVVTTLEGRAEETQTIPPHSPSPFIDARQSGATPKITSSGIGLSVPSRVGPNSAILIHGAVETAVDRATVIPTSSSDEPPLLLMSLLLVKLDALAPVQLDLAVPATTQKSSLTPSTVKAFFTFDLRTALGPRSLSGKYQTYLVVGDRTAGPYEINIE